MRLLTAVVVLTLGFASAQTAFAATSGVQSGRSGSTAQGTRTAHPGMPPAGFVRPGLTHTGIPHLERPRTGFARTGIGRSGFRGGLRGGGALLAPLGPLYPYEVY